MPLDQEKRTVDLEAAIAILQELKKSATPDQLVALHKALLPTRDELTTVDASSQPPPKLVRRKSMAVPGLATRNPTDFFRKRDEKPIVRPAPPTQEETSTWRLEQLGPSPLTRIASLDVPQVDQSDHRAQTPGDMDYATLTNKIGTLMITNGAPSPAPSIISRHLDRRTSLPALHQEEYFGIGSGHQSTSGGSADFRVSIHRSETIGPSSGYAELDAQSTEIPRRARRSRVPSELMLQRPLTPEPNEEHDSSHPSKKLPKLSADDYIAELQASPYGETPYSRATPSPRPPGDSDEGYHDQSNTDRLRTEALQILDGSVAARLTLGAERIPIGQGSVAASDQGLGQSLPQIRLQRPAHTVHSDSGYSSGSSLKAMQLSQSQAGSFTTRSVQNEDAGSDEVTEVVPSTPDRRQHGQNLDESVDAADGRSLYTINVMLATSPLRGNEGDIEQGTGAEPKVETETDTKAETKSSWRKSLRRSKSWKRMSLRDLTSPSQSPTPEVPTDVVAKEQSPEPQMPQRHDSAMKQDSPEKATSQPTRKRLQKRNSSGAQPTVQSIKPIETGSIPNVPEDLAAGYSKRIEESPGMDHLEDTSVPPTGLMESSAVSIRFPSPVPTEEVDDTLSSLPEQIDKRKRSSKRVRSPSPLKQVFSFRRKSKSAPPEDMNEKKATPIVPNPPAKAAPQRSNGSSGVATVSDFGTVTHSLGGSPYDIALSSLPVMLQVSRSSAVQPHHFSTALVNPSKNGQYMDDATASEYARIRSNNRAEHKQKQEQKKRKGEQDQEQGKVASESSKSLARPVSYHDQQHQGQQKQQLESQLSSSVPSIPNFSRPQSMIPKASLTGYDNNNGTITELDNKSLPAEPQNHTNGPAYRPYRRGLLAKSFSQSQPGLPRAATLDIREEKIPVERKEGPENEICKAHLERRHTDKPSSTADNAEPCAAEEKMVVDLEDDLAVADAQRSGEAKEKRQRDLPSSLRIQTHGWEQTSSFWRERREAFGDQDQGHSHVRASKTMHGRSMSVQHRSAPRHQDQRGTQLLQRPTVNNRHHARIQSQQAMHSLSQPSSANSSARASPSISPAWSPVPQEILSPVKQLHDPIASAFSSPRTKKRSSIQRYYSTVNKKRTQPIDAKASVESVAEEEERPAVPPKTPKTSIPKAIYSTNRQENHYHAQQYGVQLEDVPVPTSSAERVI